MSNFLKRLGQRADPDRKLDLERASTLTWSQVQSLLRATFRRRGYTVEDVSRDQSPVDMVLQKGDERVFLECHHWQVWEVPDRAVHELAGYASGAGVDHAVMVTSGRFSEDARAFAAGRGLELIDGVHLTDYVAA
jgi:restriction system protein